ncbi:hypothetical protein CAI21_21680 [Alkalilimnicola ehrlichii]|uniref:DUF1364 domain-containing protein n=1 Tax=Alkalilimnicola ehrlichii TaxID=351052 RepID=A0A3E0WSS0_9GAMM|nr:nuclease domain-containing protein [Alkalilimnicola ehrlichii]RFA24444.1 hypothetical protein CAI21_21680 [Alkalilimnicola ehrlichii]RFA35201.1 hypothetical protein CAL65_13695 [Alkalilimnicola ehrlichii]
MKVNAIKSNKLRKSAKGHPCTTRIPGVCNGDPDTSCLAHPPMDNGGMGGKASDECGAITCSDCHDCIDRRRYRDVPRELVYECWIRGHQETLTYWRQMGLLSVKGAAA